MAAKKSTPIQVEILGKKSIFFGRDITAFLVNDLVSVSKAETFVIITDTQLATIHLPDLLKAFSKVATVHETAYAMEATKKQESFMGFGRRTRSTNKTVLSFVIPPGEGSKSREMAGKIQDYLLGQSLNPNTCLIAFGGGVVGDLVGYVASTFLRGVEFVQIPTTLLAMVDSSVGGKNGVDTPEGKNLIGTIYQPIRIYADPKYLITLPQREIANGMAEVIKTYALIGEKEFGSLEEKVDELPALLAQGNLKDSPEAQNIFAQLILSSMRFKAEIVTEDVGDKGHRQALNFGHTIGHAIESHFDGTILHGECVAVGMIIEQHIAVTTKWGKGPDLDRIKNVLVKCHLPTSILELEILAHKLGKAAPVSTDQLLRIMKHDKKNSGDQIHMALLASFGNPARQNKKAIPVDDSTICSVLRRQINQKGRILKVDTPADSPYAMKCVPPTLQGSDNSIIVIGAHGSILGDKLAAALNWNFVQEPTVDLFKESLHQCIMSLPPSDCGTLKNHLLSWMKKGGIVIHLLSPLADDHDTFADVEFVSNYSYFFNGDIQSQVDLEGAADSLLHLVHYAHGKHFNILPKLGTPSYFLILLSPDVTPYVKKLPSMISGTWAVEFRLDLLATLYYDQRRSLVDFKEAISQQVSLIRGAVLGHPIIFTLRSAKEGGCFSTEDISDNILLDIFHYAVRLGCEFIDLEMELASKLWVEIGHAAELKSLIIASYHSLDKPLDWTGEECEALVEKAVELGGDIIKLVSVVSEDNYEEDNRKVVQFVDGYYKDVTNSVPLLALNMGVKGQSTRVTNRFLTPVTHQLLVPTDKGARLGQLTCQEIQKAYYQNRVPQRKEFFIFGADIGYSLSPLIHNANFDYFHLPFNYAIKDTPDLEEVRKVIRSPSFGGGSVTIPHKQAIIPLLDSISKVAEQIGAVNTIVVEEDGKLRGENTDWLGILHCVKRTLRMSPRELSKTSALLIGAGGTARAALYALNTFGFRKIYLSNRTESKLEELAKCYPAESGRAEMKIYNGKKESLLKPDCPLVLIVNTTTGDSGMCPNSFVNEVLQEGNSPRVLVQMAYSKNKAAEELKPWISLVSGHDVLVEQAIWAAIHWTGLKPDAEYIRAAVEKR